VDHALLGIEMKNESEEITKYEFEPFEKIFLSRREEILRLVNVSSYALRSMEGAARLSKVLKHDAEHVERVREIETMALREVESDFPMIHNAATVLLWGALEATFRDFLVRWLARYPAARQVPELRKIRVQVAEYESLEDEDRMRYLVQILERELAASLKPGTRRFDCLLKPFGIIPKIGDAERRDLNEMAAIRNVIVHRASIADERLLELCPWLGLRQGEVVHVSRVSFFRFLGAASNYAAAIVSSAESVSNAVSGGRLAT